MQKQLIMANSGWGGIGGYYFFLLVFSLFQVFYNKLSFFKKN